jgi:predicted MPP superfamily phosphohydrolase
MVSFPTVYQRVIAHKRFITFSLIFAFCVYPLIDLGKFGPTRVAFRVILVMFMASQFFWIRHALDLGERFIPGKPRRVWLTAIACFVELFFFVYSYTHMGGVVHLFLASKIIGAADPRPQSVLMEGALSWWLAGSVLGFGLVIVFWSVDRAASAAAWVYRRAGAPAAGNVDTPQPGTVVPDLTSAARRHFLRQTAFALSATPFVASAYGLLYGRFDVQITRQHIRLARLPKSFDGFRIAQLSDLHISPFMPAAEIRRCVTITNQLKPDLVVMTGDYLSWDPAAQGEVVQALAGLRAPYGVFGSLGNHESITDTEESITRLFAAQDIHILRQERAAIRLGGEMLNLIGIDDSITDDRAIKGLVMPGTVNIVLNHNPNDFDQAVELGFDLMLAGHTHGGQLSLESLHRGLSLARLETPYVSGWFEKSGGQLYVNRGIGTTILPIRLGARPEITILELSRT